MIEVHEPNCQCEHCQVGRLREYYSKPRVSGALWFFGTMVILFVVWWMFRTWYVDTHCTMVLGTRVCQ